MKKVHGPFMSKSVSFPSLFEPVAKRSVLCQHELTYSTALYVEESDKHSMYSLLGLSHG